MVTRTVAYHYDPFNRRMAKVVTPSVGPATIEHYIYDGAAGAVDDDKQIVLRFNTAGAVAGRYLNGPAVDMVLADAQVDPSTGLPDHIYWPLADNLSTVRDLAEYDEQTGITSIVNHIQYDAFGTVTSETNAAVDTIFGFTGRESDEESDLYYYRARYYDPHLGQFASEDPLGFEAKDPNLRRYVGNGPVDAMDPSGRKCRHLPIVRSAIPTCRNILSRQRVAAACRPTRLLGCLFVFLFVSANWTNDTHVICIVAPLSWIA